MNAFEIVTSADLKKLNQLETPCFVYCPEVALESYRSLKECLGGKLIVSVKANSNSDLIAFMANEVDGFEATSENELKTIAQVVKGERYINNPSFTEDTLKKAAASKTKIILDHPEQITLLEGISSDRLEVILRINATSLFRYYDVGVKLREDHFGMSIDDSLRVSRELSKKGISLLGIHIFKGSYTFDKTAVETIEAVSTLLNSMEEEYGHKLSKVNLGGGFSGEWQTSGFDFGEYRRLLASHLDGYEIYHESGRGIFESCGVFICDVVSTKELNGKHVAITNGGLSQSFLLAQTESPLKRYVSPYILGGEKIPNLDGALIVGSTCNRDDIIGKIKQGELYPVKGSKLIYADCGAYVQTYSPVNFLGLPQAKTYIYFEDSDR